MTSTQLRRMVRETDALLGGALARGAVVVDGLARDILAAVRRAGDLAQVRAALADPLALIDPAARGALLAALLAAMLTGDLLGRTQVAAEARRARVILADVATAFPGQSPLAFAEVGVLELIPLPPEEAIRLFRDRIPMASGAFEQLVGAYRARAFTVAGQQTDRAVDVVKAWLTKVLEEGLTLRDFRDGLAEAAAAGGITAVNPYHAATVFETNVQTAYNAGRYEMYHAEGMADAFPYFQYHTVGDDRVRLSHAQMEGYIARRDDPVWDTWWPPNGFNCRCTVTAISVVEAEQSGIRPSRRQVPRPDPGFAGNAATAIRTAGL